MSLLFLEQRSYCLRNWFLGNPGYCKVARAWRFTASPPPYTIYGEIGADPRYSPASGPWGDPPLTIYAKGQDDMGQGTGKSSGKDKGIDYGKAKGKHKTKDKRASPYKGGSYAGHEGKGGQDYQLGKGKGKGGKDKGKGENPNKGKNLS